MGRSYTKEEKACGSCIYWQGPRRIQGTLIYVDDVYTKHGCLKDRRQFNSNATPCHNFKHL